MAEGRKKSLQGVINHQSLRGANKVSDEAIPLLLRKFYLGLFQEFDDMSLKGAEVVKLLEILVNFVKVNLNVFMNKKISQSSHRQDRAGKFGRYNVIFGNDLNCFLARGRLAQVIIYDDMVADIQKGLYANLDRI